MCLRAQYLHCTVFNGDALETTLLVSTLSILNTCTCEENIDCFRHLCVLQSPPGFYPVGNAGVCGLLAYGYLFHPDQANWGRVYSSIRRSQRRDCSEATPTDAAVFAV